MNVCYANCVKGIEPDERQSVQEKIELFEEQIGMRVNPEEIALAELRKWQDAQGIHYDDPEGELPADLKAEMEKEAEAERLGEFMGPGGQKLRRGKNGTLIGKQIE
jgi:hypothetical protein